MAMLDPRRMMRWVYLGRFSLASAIFVAAVFVWQSAATADTLIVSLAFAATMLFTVGSAAMSEVERRPLGRSFLYLQSMFDLVLVTTVVHVTGAGASQFAALYILVIATAALLLPTGGGLLIAALGNALYFADVIVFHDTALDVGVWMQLAVFAVVALGSGWISARLQAAGAGTAELAAELSRVRLEADDILRTIRSGILTVDTEGVLLYGNPAAGALLGLDVEARVGHPILEAIARIAPELANVLTRTLARGVRTARAEGMVTLDDRAFPVGMASTFVEPDNAVNLASATIIFQDISDQKRLESLHLRAERLEAVAELSASLAHEIKNPLASIRSAVEQIARYPRANEDERTLADLIVRESDRLARLLTEFLDFARVRVTRTSRVDVGAIARGAASLVGAHPDRREGVRVSCVTPDDPLIVDGDEDLLHRAVFNLVLNAVQAAPADSEVRIEAAAVAPEQVPPGLAFDQGAVALRVSDDGPGIPEEIHARLFEPFMTTKSGGSGLGLPVVHRAIAAHRGEVLVDTDGTGTRFTILLPPPAPVADALGAVT
jgi:two-component system, NtrC family, sensor histidine kinase PilS